MVLCFHFGNNLKEESQYIWIIGLPPYIPAPPFGFNARGMFTAHMPKRTTVIASGLREEARDGFSS